MSSVASSASALGTASLPPMMVAARLGRLREAMEQGAHPVLVVTNLVNVRYLSGFSGSAGILVVTGERAVLVTDGRYRLQAADQVSAAGSQIEVAIHLGSDRLNLLSQVAGVADQVAIEEDWCSYGFASLLAKALPEAELVATSGLVEGLREHKDPGELARIERAAAISDAAFETVVRLLVDQPTEAELALALDFEMRRLGAEDRAFETIVASGPNAAMPHHRPEDRRINPGELVVVDYGATVDGYRSDATRTVCLGQPPPDALRVVEVVAAAQEAGVAAVAAGVAACAIDARCREVIRDAGWGDLFVHGTGHGVGLDIHEAPAVSSRSADTLYESAVITVEPGVYMAGKCGARIEDTVVVTREGCRVLTRAHKELMVS